MKVLELFAGTRSIGKAFEAHGHQVFSVEWDKSFENIDLYEDVLKVTPEEIANAYVREQDWYSNGIAHYIECREGYDRLLDLESFGGKIRDTEGEFEGAEFRDEKTGLMFAYDYKNKFTLRVWGTTFKPALVKEMKRLGIRVCDRTEATALLLDKTGKKELWV